MKKIVVFGATGAMGRYIIANLDKKNWSVRAFTRNENSPLAQALLAHGNLELFQGNTDNVDDLKRAIDGVDAVFCNTDFWTNVNNPENERIQMHRILEISKEKNIAHVVFSSLENCMTLSNGEIPVTHFDSKAIVEQEINWQRSLDHFKQLKGFYSTSVTVLRTLPYFENLMSFFVPQKRVYKGKDEIVFKLPLGEKGKFSMVALDDIGWFTNYILNRRSQYGGKTLVIGSDTVSGNEIAQKFESVTGIKSVYEPISDEEFLKLGGPAHDALNHFKFHREIGMKRNFDSLKKLHPELLSFDSWLQKTQWKGEQRLIQKKLAE